jgi:hypothetical protein
MKIAIIGSTQYKDKFINLEGILVQHGHEVKIPAFDNHPNFNELDICEFNLGIIKWADEVYLIWDNRSIGAIFDIGMVFALNKPLKIQYIESKTFANVVTLYSKKFDIGDIETGGGL